jgi:hypothetical protein
MEKSLSGFEKFIKKSNITFSVSLFGKPKV